MVEINVCQSQLCSNVSVAAIDCNANSCKLPSSVKKNCKCYQRVPEFTPVKQRICCGEDFSKEDAEGINNILNYAEFINPDKEEIEKKKKLIKDLKDLRKKEDQICGYYDKDNVFYSCGPDCCNEGAGCPGECVGAEPDDPQSVYKDPLNLLTQLEDIIKEQKESPAEIISNTDKLFSYAIILLISLSILLLIITIIKWTFKTIVTRKSYKYIASTKLQQGYDSLFNLLGQFKQKLP